MTGDAFDQLTALNEAISGQVAGRGLNLWSSPESELARVTTWEERALVKLMSFYSCCSVCGRIFPHLDDGLALTRELEAVGAHSTIKALKELQELEKAGAILETDARALKIERQIPEDFAWAGPILEFVRKNSGRFLSERSL